MNNGTQTHVRRKNTTNSKWNKKFDRLRSGMQVGIKWNKNKMKKPYQQRSCRSDAIITNVSEIKDNLCVILTSGSKVFITIPYKTSVCCCGCRFLWRSGHPFAISFSFRSLFHFHLHFNRFGSAIQCFHVCILYLRSRFHLQQPNTRSMKTKTDPFDCALIQMSNLLEISFIASFIEFTFLASAKQFYHAVFMTMTKKQDKKKSNWTSGREGDEESRHN